jgi:hypothetical protein
LAQYLRMDMFTGAEDSVHRKTAQRVGPLQRRMGM